MNFRKGFAHFIPLFAIAVILAGAFSGLSVRSEQKQKQAVGQVLSSREGEDQQEDEDVEDNEDRGQTSVSSNSSNSGTSRTKIKLRTNDQETQTEVESEGGKTKVKIESPEGKFESELEGDKEETQIRTGGLRIEVKVEGNRIVTKVKDENGEDVELSDEEENELFRDTEEILEEEDIEIATDSADLGFSHKGRRVRTHFPLSVNPVTGELFVTTLAGTKVVAILPDVAIENMIRAGVMTRVDEEATPSASPTPEATPSSESSELTDLSGSGIELTVSGDEPVYEVKGVKVEKFLGILPIDLKLDAVVSASSGQLLDLRQGFFTRILDLLSI